MDNRSSLFTYEDISEATDDDAILIASGWVILCWESWSRTQDLRGVCSAVIASLGDYMAKDKCTLLGKAQRKWCEKVAEIDAGKASADMADTVRTWSLRYALVSVLMHNMYGRCISDNSAFIAELHESRKRYESFFMERKGFLPDWTIPRVTWDGRRGSVLEDKLKKQ